MTQAAWTDSFVERAEVFAHYNGRRIEYLRDAIPQVKRDVFDLLPFLLHEDGPGLVGNAAAAHTPAGISCFAPPAHLRELVKQYFPSFVPQRQAKPRLPIVFLALIGSAGTIGFTEGSDLDYWLGIETGKLEPGALALLNEKLRALQQWAATTASLEVHFYVADLRKIRDNDYGDLNLESCGSSMGKLLKEEFYRTGIFLQGKIPYYWVAPCGIDDALYETTVGRLCASAVFPHDNYVDLGPGSSIGRREFFGAALWQLFKGLRSPFKSVLKMALLDRYAAGRGNVVPLCELFKREIFSSPSTESIDPYLFMMESLRTYYTGLGLISVRQLLEECFLIRNLLTSGTPAPEGRARTHYFLHVARRWGWTEEQAEAFARFGEWDFFEQENLHGRITSYLVDAYQRIRAATPAGEVAISDRDLTIAGKKLWSFFERREGKVPFEFTMLKPREITDVDMQELYGHDAAGGWSVSLRGRTKRGPRLLLTRTLPDPVVACAWLALNGFYRGGQQVRIKGTSPLTTGEAAHLIRSLAGFFPGNAASELKVEELLDDRYITHLYLIVNLDRPESDRDLVSVFALFRNTMGELFYERRRGQGCTVWLLNEILTKRIGGPYLKALTWSVHTPQGPIFPARKVALGLSDQVKGFIKAYSSRQVVRLGRIGTSA